MHLSATNIRVLPPPYLLGMPRYDTLLTLPFMLAVHYTSLVPVSKTSSTDYHVNSEPILPLPYIQCY
jgi:hypothetical protein